MDQKTCFELTVDIPATKQCNSPKGSHYDREKKGGGVDIFLAIVLAAFLIWQKDSLSKII
jgi:hypothetical protein